MNNYSMLSLMRSELSVYSELLGRYCYSNGIWKFMLMILKSSEIDDHTVDDLVVPDVRKIFIAA